MIDFVFPDAPVFYDPQLYISESEWIDDAFTEAAESTTKKNFMEKAFALLGKIFNVIIARCKQITSWVTSIFHTKKVSDKTLDQIAEAVLNDLDVEPIKHLKFYFDDNQQIRMNAGVNAFKKKLSDPKIVGHDKKDRPQQEAVALVFNIIKQPALLDPIIDMLKQSNESTDGVRYNREKMQKAIDAVWAASVLSLSCTFSMEDWTRLNERCIKLQEALFAVDVDTYKTDKIYTADYADTINQIIKLSAFIQTGLNYIGDGMRQVYELDAAYHDKINAKNYTVKLPEFVKMCLDANIPAKYLHHAVRQICDLSINAKVDDYNTKGDVNATLTGNGRFVMFPGDPSLRDYVIKVAYNYMGIRGNRNEFILWERIKTFPDITERLYHIYDTVNDPNNCVILCDRAKPIAKYGGVDTWNQEMKELCKQHNLGFIIFCNDSGFGELPNGKTVSVDFGNVGTMVSTT